MDSVSQPDPWFSGNCRSVFFRKDVRLWFPGLAAEPNRVLVGAGDVRECDTGDGSRPTASVHPRSNGGSDRRGAAVNRRRDHAADGAKVVLTCKAPFLRIPSGKATVGSGGLVRPDSWVQVLAIR